MLVVGQLLVGSTKQLEYLGLFKSVLKICFPIFFSQIIPDFPTISSIKILREGLSTQLPLRYAPAQAKQVRGKKPDKNIENNLK